MTIPRRFAIEYPERALSLIEMIEGQIGDLAGTFGLLAAGAVLTMPYERMKPGHFLSPIGGDADLAVALRTLKKRAFLTAPFWRKPADPDAWRMTRIVSSVNDSKCWRDEAGFQPFAKAAKNTIGDRKADDVLRVLRNALAHGNIVYLDHNGVERAGANLEFLGFLSRYEETEAHGSAAVTYRLIAVKPRHFIEFLKDWASWVAGLSPELKYMAA